ncbi:MAG: DUF7683 domain-containing protein [Dehalococcoidia bacterium]
MRRWVTQFRKSGDERLVRGYELRGARLAQLQRLFEPDGDDPRMVLCYPVTEKQRPLVERLIGEPLNLQRYDYFVEAYTDVARASRPRPAAAASRRASGESRPTSAVATPRRATAPRR